ncbi:MAG: hypothetical protein ACJATF_004205, partial [Flavobacteriales bacterium]
MMNYEMDKRYIRNRSCGYREYKGYIRNREGGVMDIEMLD